MGILLTDPLHIFENLLVALLARIHYQSAHAVYNYTGSTTVDPP